MTDEIVIPQSKAVALFVAMGFKTAKKWNCAKLTDKINQIDSEPDEPFEDSELDELMDDLLDAEEAIVVPDEGDEEEETKPKKKSKKKEKVEKKTDKKKKKEKKEAKPARTRENSIDAVTIALITAKPMTLETLVKQLSKKFPDNDPEILERTTKRRLTGYLQSKHDVVINKSEKGAYSID